MQSTKSASISPRRMSPLPDWLLLMLPLVSTKPAIPFGDRRDG